MRTRILSSTLLLAALGLFFAGPARADVASAVSSRSTLDTRTGQLTLQPADVPKAIADNASTTSTLAVSGLVGIIADVNVSLDLTHAKDSDLTVTLVSPLGMRVKLIAKAGGTGTNFTATVLDDAAATAIASGTAPFTGSFRPAEPLGVLNGLNPNGTWTLEILDDTATNTGTLNSWSIQFDVVTSSAKDILTFDFGALGPATITGTHISLTAPSGTNVTALAPTFTMSAGATCDHGSGTSYDFTSPVVYTVLASDLTTKAYTVTVSVPPAFTSAAPPATGKVGTSYNFTCTASGTTPITFSVTSGALPTGLTLGSGGVISGMPGATGTFTGTITASNGTLPDATQDFSIVISPATYTITASAGSHGSVSPTGAVTVISGANQTFTITPDSGYVVGDVTVDGVSQGSIPSYAFTNVSANHTISPVFTAVPEIAVEQPVGTNLIDGSASIDCGTAIVGSAASAMTFTLRNLGAADLTGLAVAMDGANAGDFTVGSLGATTLTAGMSTTFSVTFTPGAAGSRAAAIHIASNDRNKNPFDIALTGTGTVAPMIFTWSTAASGNWSDASKWTNNQGSGTAPNAVGQSNYILNFNIAGTYTATNDLNPGFLLNRINVGNGITTLAGNSLTFAANGVTPPRLFKTGPSALFIMNPLNLASDLTIQGLAIGPVTISGAISGPGGLIKSGAGTLTLSALNSYGGNTTVSSGTLLLDTAGGLTFVVSNAANNKITGAGTATLNGVFAIDTSAVSVATGSWTLADITTKSFGGSFSVTGFNKGANVWTKADGVRIWTFSEATGVLIVSTAGTIKSFGIPGYAGVIDDSALTIHLSVPCGTNLTTLAPTYTLSSGICDQPSGSPPSPTFAAANPATYTVTDGAIVKAYSVTVTVLPPAPPVLDYVRWFDASPILASDGTPISTWSDLSTHAANATVPSGNANPTYVANAGTGTGLGALYFAKKDDASDSGAMQFTNDDNIRTVFSIFKGSSFLLTDSGAYDFHRPSDDNPNDPLWGLLASGNITGGATYVNGVLVNGTTFSMPTDLHNGFNLVEVLTTGSVQADSFNKDRGYHAGNQYQAEVIIYDRLLSENERLSVEGYLMNKWFGAGDPATITSFGLPSNPAVIRGTNISLTVPYGTDVTSLAPTFTLCPGATCDHVSGVAYDFTTPVTYAVLGSDLTTKAYVVTVIVAPPLPVPPSFTSAAPPATGTQGTAYNFTCTASGTTPITFTVSSGALPTGLSLSSAGAITGTPSTAGTFVGTITASNGTLPNATQGFSIVISRVTYTITASAGAGGLISPPGVVTVNSGAIRSFSIVPKTGYVVGDVTVDGVSKGAIGGYTFMNVTANHTISAVFTAVPEIAVEQPLGVNLVDDSASIDCGSVGVGGTSADIIFTVKNLGNADLTGLAVTKNGSNPDDFSVGNLDATTLPTGTSTTFTVTFTPGAAGLRTAAIHLASNDASRNPFDINLTGTGEAAPSIAANNPASQTVENGGSAVLAVSAGGFPAPTLQWYHGLSGDTTNPVSGATGSSFTTPVLTASTSYWVRATNVYGIANSGTATLTVVASSNANLSGIALSTGTLAPVFSPAVTAYQVALPNETAAMTVTPTLAHAQATALLRLNDGSYVPIASGDTSGALGLDVGINLIEILVTAENGSTRSYVIEVTRAMPPMPDLVVGVTAPATGMMGTSFDYAITVANSGTAAASGVTVRFAVPANLTVQATVSPDHGFTTLSSAGGFVMFANGSLAAGESAILTVTVAPVLAATYTAPAGAAVADPANTVTESNETNNTSPTAVVTVVRPPDVGPVITSQPAASQTIQSYTLVGLGVAASGSPEPDFQWYRGERGDTSNPVAGATSADFSTATLNATTRFWVRASNTVGTAESDTATVTVVPSTNADLANLTLGSGSLSPAFAHLTYSYAVSVPNAVGSVTVTPAAANAGASVRVNGTPVAAGSASPAIPLTVGTNVITIVVTAADGATNRSYAITVTRAEPMVVTTNAADGLTAQAAALHGTVNPRGAATVYFEYGTSTSYGRVSAGSPITGELPVAVSATVSNLAGATTYHFRAVAVGSGSTVYGTDLTFGTTPEPPLAATGNPVALTGTGATLVGAVNPKGLPAEVHFEYGLTAIYGATVTVTQAPSGSVLADVTAPVTGLIAGATYHCRVVATTTAGTAFGEDVPFVATAGTGTGTGSPSAAPGVTTGGVAVLTTTSAELLGSVESHGGTTLAQFEYGPTDSYGSVTVPLGVGNGDAAAAVSLTATGLSPGTVYHYRLSATNSLGTNRGADLTFTSQFLAPDAVTGGATALSTTSARVTGTVRAHHALTAASVDYGTDPAQLSNSVVADPAAVDGDNVTSVSALLINLTQGTTYYYRVRAESTGGIATGAIRSFDLGVLSGLFRQFPPALATADHQGSLTVDLTPTAIGGAWRFAGESQWRMSGIAATGLASGDRVIEYRPVPGYLQPSTETVVVFSGAAPVVLARAYTASTTTGSGGLTVTLKPENLAAASVPAGTRAQWRLFGENDSQWKDSGTDLTEIPTGDWLIECKPVAGRTTPAPGTARVTDGATTSATITYYVTNDAAGTPPGPLTFGTVSGGTALPYAYVGQITSDVGASSGFVVRPRVVATAGHVVFDDGTLSAATGLRWLFQRDIGVNEPVPQVPRGYYLLSGYAAQRAADNSPGTSTPQSQNLDAAAMYFLEDAGRGGFSGYLASDSTVNEFVVSTALKTLVGYPVDGIDPALQGRLHATPISNITFSPAFGQTYTTSEIRSSGGNSGGPLCVQYTGGTWYPAAIYLGGTAQTVVRAINGDVADLFGFAEASGNAGVGSTGGSLTQSGTSATGTPALGALQVMIEPAAARAAGAGWRIQAQAGYQAGGTRIDGLSPSSYTVSFATVAGFVPPASQAVTSLGGQLTTLTFTYEAVISPPVINSPNTVTGTRGQPLVYQISALNSPGFYSLLGSLPAGMSFYAGSGLISGVPREAGNFPVTVGATNAGGSDSRLVNLTCRPVVSAQSLTAPYQQAMSYHLSSSETGTGVTYAAGELPGGLALDPTTGWITGSPTTPGVFVVPVTVSKKGASATNNLTLTITGSAPVITLQPVAEKSVEYGLSTTLQVAASGLPAPTFQWYEGYSGDTGHPVSGGGSATFTTPSLTSKTRYGARASSISGSADSTATQIWILPSANAKLSNLWLSAGSLSPGFNADIPTYAAAIPYATGTVSLTPEVQVAQSSVAINGMAVPSHVASAPIPMAVGPNVITIVATAGDGISSKNYTVTVTRAQPPVCATLAATNASDTSAQLHGTVTPNSPVSVMFQYGQTASYGETTFSQYVTGAAALQIQATLTGLTGNATYHYRIVVSAGTEMFFGDDMTFTTTLERPLAATGTPAVVTPTSVRLIGAVNPKGQTTAVHFEYGLTTAYGMNITPDQSPAAGSTVVDMWADVTGLNPGATYHYRLVAVSDAGTSYGNDISFQAISGGGTGDGIVDAPPTVTTSGTADLTSSTATLLGTVNPNEGTTFVFFEYGLNTAYGSATASVGIGNGNQPADVTLPVTGLVPGTLYHYRLVASNSLGSSFGGDMAFTAVYNPPVCTTGAAAALSATSATLNGTVSARGTAAEVWFDFGKDGVTFPDGIRGFPSSVSGDVETPVSADLTSLDGSQTYYYRVRAVSSGGTGTGDARTFQPGALLGLQQVFTDALPATELGGRIQVNLLPAGVGGWRFVGETQWRASGVMVTGLITAQRDIEYLPVANRIQPQGETVGIVSGEPMVVLERTYYDSATVGSGTLRVLLDPESISLETVALGSRAQWRIVGDSDTAWRNSGSERGDLMPGSYLVECKPVAGKSTPTPVNMVVTSGATTTSSLTYFPATAPSLNPPVVVPFTTASTSQNMPYAYCGQIRSGTGTHSGFVVKPRVVATAAQAVFDEATLAATSDTQWLLQRDQGTYEPDPQVPRGFYLFDGYGALRASENTPGTLALASQNLNVAALYFSADAGRGGFSGFLSSDAADNEYLQSSALKTLVGYPVNGISASKQGRMHATAPLNATFTLTLDRTYVTSGIHGIGGMAGGPLCVQYKGGAYYPAGIYVGGTSQSSVRAIDSRVIALFTSAETSGNGGGNSTGGGITHSSFSSIGSATQPGGLKVTIMPQAAQTAGAGWLLKPETSYRLSGAQKVGLNAGSYILQLKTVSGFQAPTQQTITVTGGQLQDITFTYQEEAPALDAWRMAKFGTYSNTGIAADGADPDGDGQTNLSEYAAGTDPNNGADFFRVLTTTRTATSYTVTAAGKAGRIYVLERRATLDGGTWIQAATSSTLTADGTVTLTDPAPPANSGFYRLRVAMP